MSSPSLSQTCLHPLPCPWVTATPRIVHPLGQAEEHLCTWLSSGCPGSPSPLPFMLASPGTQEHLSLLVNAVKLLNEKYLIFPFLQHHRQCSEQQWGG